MAYSGSSRGRERFSPNSLPVVFRLKGPVDVVDFEEDIIAAAFNEASASSRQSPLREAAYDIISDRNFDNKVAEDYCQILCNLITLDYCDRRQFRSVIDAAENLAPTALNFMIAVIVDNTPDIKRELDDRAWEAVEENLAKLSRLDRAIDDLKRDERGGRGPNIHDRDDRGRGYARERNDNRGGRYSDRGSRGGDNVFRDEARNANRQFNEMRGGYNRNREPEKPRGYSFQEAEPINKEETKEEVINPKLESGFPEPDTITKKTNITWKKSAAQPYRMLSDRTTRISLRQFPDGDVIEQIESIEGDQMNRDSHRTDAKGLLKHISDVEIAKSIVRIGTAASGVGEIINAEQRIAEIETNIGGDNEELINSLKSDLAVVSNPNTVVDESLIAAIKTIQSDLQIKNIATEGREQLVYKSNIMVMETFVTDKDYSSIGKDILCDSTTIAEINTKIKKYFDDKEQITTDLYIYLSSINKFLTDIINKILAISLGYGENVNIDNFSIDYPELCAHLTKAGGKFKDAIPKMDLWLTTGFANNFVKDSMEEVMRSIVSENNIISVYHVNYSMLYVDIHSDELGFNTNSKEGFLVTRDTKFADAVKTYLNNTTSDFMALFDIVVTRDRKIYYFMPGLLVDRAMVVTE